MEADDFDGQITPEETQEDWIQWNDDLQSEISELYQDDEPADIDDDHGMNPYDGTYENWDFEL
jgi:hypothetical protein